MSDDPGLFEVIYNCRAMRRLGIARSVMSQAQGIGDLSGHPAEPLHGERELCPAQVRNPRERLQEALAMPWVPHCDRPGYWTDKI